ncbi:MAG: CDP-diacylglycerol--serine O-phosphatidyltransferase [Chthoniobacteraceae bacterium]
MSDDGNPKIYLLPNLATAGNLCFGFASILKILEGALLKESDSAGAQYSFHFAIWCILGACICDLLDGRLARLGGHESDFGREFDSIADIVSFGVAPALMVYRIVLSDFSNWGWAVASLYLVCGALRLARFNCLAAANSAAANKEFKGFPIPAAAGLIASLTLCLLWWQGEHELGRWKYVLPPLMIFLSWMMFSGFKYPSFKSVNWRTRRTIPHFLVIVIILVVTSLNYEWMPALLFITYLIYGFVRPFISRQWRREIEEDEDDEDEQTPESPRQSP